jgi:tetratricopeptide (TPR) repeat protein
MKVNSKPRQVFEEAGLHFARYFLGLAASNPLDYATLEPEIDNLQSALEVLDRLRAWKDLGQLVGSINLLLRGRGSWHDSRHWLERALSHAEEIGDVILRIELTESLADVTASQGERQQAIELYEKALQLARRKNNRLIEARVYYGLGTVHNSLGDTARAYTYWQNSLRLAEKIGDEPLIAVVGYQLGVLEEVSNDYELPKHNMTSVTELAKRLGLKELTSHLRAMTTFAQGNLKEAEAQYIEALEVSRQEGDKQGQALAVYQLGVIAHRQNNPQAALDLYRESESIVLQLGDDTGLKAVLSSTGLAYLKLQRFDHARSYYERSVALHRRSGHPSELAENLYWFGYALANSGDPIQAKTVFEESLAIFESLRSAQSAKVKSALDRLLQALAH